MTENILDHGGIEGDDSDSAMHTNIAAINDASEAASDNTVYLPAGVWYIGLPDEWGGFALRPGHSDTNRGAAGLGFVGDGPDQTTLRWGYAEADKGNMIRYEGPDQTNVVWRDLTYDGNQQNLDFGSDGFQDGFQLRSNVSASFENVRIQHIQNGGFRVFDGCDLTFDRCTFFDMGIGRANQTDGSGGSQPISLTRGACDVTIRDSEFQLIHNNPVDYGNGVTGTLTMDNIYAEGCGVGVLKINDMSSASLSRIRFIGQTQELLDARNSDLDPEYRGRWFLRRQDGDTTDPVPVSLEHIEATDMTRGAIRVANGYDVDLSGGTDGPIAFQNVAFENGSEAIEDRDSEIAFDLNEVSVHDVDGVVFDLPTSTGSVGTLRRDNTGGLGSTGDVSIGEDAVGADPFAPDVPAQSDVGVNSNGTDSTSDNAPAVSWFSPSGGDTVSGSVTVQVDASDSEDSDDSLAVEYRVDGGTWTGAAYNADTGYYEDAWDTTTVSDGTHTLEARATDSAGNSTTAAIDLVVGAVFEEWTPQWISTVDDWGVVADTAYTGGYALAFDPAEDTGGRYAISSDQVGTPADVEVLDCFRVPAFTDGSQGSHAWMHLRASGSAGNESSYWVEVMERGDCFRLGKYTNGSADELKRFGTPVENTFYYRRFRAEGDTLKVKIWQADKSEPSNWDVELTDTDLTDGWVGPGTWDPKLVETDTFSVATGGATAEFVGADSTPSVAWASPSDGATVSGTVTVQVDASDSEDSDDSLAVEYRVDGGTWTGAAYNADTGYYEDAWDTTTVSDGDHTLEARVTDSAGNTSTAAITVTTDNSSSAEAPTVDSLSLSEVETDDSDAEFDASWGVSDSDGDLDSVELTLVQDSDGAIEDTVTRNVTGDSAAGTTRLVAPGDDGSGNGYTVELTVTDGTGATTSDTASASESETTSDSSPTVDRFSVSEANRPDPHAEITVVWDVSDPDGDLDTLEIDIADSSGTVQSVTWSLSGARASDTDAFRIKEGDGTTFDVTLTVTDAAGHSTSKTKSVTA